MNSELIKKLQFQIVRPFVSRSAQVRCLPDMKSLHISPNQSDCRPSNFMSFTYSPDVFMSFCPYTPPATSASPHSYAQSPTFLCSRCPNHLNLPCLTTSATLWTPKRLTAQNLTLLPIFQRQSTYPPHHHMHFFRALQIPSLHTNVRIWAHIPTLHWVQSQPLLSMLILKLLLQWKCTLLFNLPKMPLHLSWTHLRQSMNIHDWMATNCLPTNTPWMFYRILTLNTVHPTLYDLVFLTRIHSKAHIHLRWLKLNPTIEIWIAELSSLSSYLILYSWYSPLQFISIGELKKRISDWESQIESIHQNWLNWNLKPRIEISIHW